MATTLKSEVTFLAVPPGGVVSLPHNLKILQTRKVVPDHAEATNPVFTILVAFCDDTVVTVRNDDTVPASCTVLCEYWYTPERAFGAASVTDLPLKPFVPNNGIAGLIAAFDLQDAYDNSAGPQATIQLDAVRNGIRLLDVVGLATPMLELDADISAQDGLRISRAPAVATAGRAIELVMGANATDTALDILVLGSGQAIVATKDTAGTIVSLSKTPAVPLGGDALDITMGPNATGLGLSIVHSGTGSAAAFQNNTAGVNVVTITKTPAAAGGGSGLVITMGANASGDGLSTTHAGSGSALSATGTGTGTVVSFTNTGTGPIFSSLDSTNTPTISSTFSRTPTVATGGTNLRLNSNANFTGIELEVLMGGGAGSVGVSVRRRALGTGISVFDQAAVASTGTAVSLTSSVTGSTGVLLAINKTPAAATAGDLCTMLTSASVSGNLWTVTHAGSGIWQSVSHTGSGSGISYTETGAGGGVLLGITRLTNAITVMASITRTPTVAGTGGENLRLTVSSLAAGIGLRVLGGANVGATLVNIGLQTAGIGLLLQEDPGSLNTGVGMDLRRNVTGSTGTLLSVQKSPPAATAGDLILLTMGAGAGATSGHMINATAGASHTGRFLTVSFLPVGEVWRITGVAGAFISALESNGQMRHADGTAAVPSISFETSTSLGFLRSAANVLDLSVAATSRFRWNSTGTGEYIPPVDDNGSIGTATNRWTLVRAVTITSGDLAFDDEACAVCRRGFAVNDNVVLRVHKVAEETLKGGKTRPVTYTVPCHQRCAV